jgi:hypothetical protein
MFMRTGLGKMPPDATQFDYRALCSEFPNKVRVPYTGDTLLQCPAGSQYFHFSFVDLRSYPSVKICQPATIATV